MAEQVDGATPLHVAVVHRPGGLRLLVQGGTAVEPAGADPLGAGARSWDELVGRSGGGLVVEQVPGWGTLVRAEFPYGPEAGAELPLTAREREVLDLLGRGRSDRQVATELGISARTVEKHVGAVLRKTGTDSRTAAVVRALDLGWMPRH